MTISADFLNPYNEKYDNTKELREYYKNDLFPKILEQFQKGDNKELLRVRIAIKDVLHDLQKEAVQNYAFKVAYSLSFMISKIHSDYILKEGINPVEIPCRLFKLYRFSREADKKINEVFQMKPITGYSKISHSFSMHAAEAQSDASGIFLMLKSMQVNIKKDYKKQYIKLLGEEMLDLSIEDLQKIWDYYKEANPNYKNEPFDEPISKNLPLHVMIRWALDKGNNKYIDILRTMLGLEGEQLPDFAEAMNYDVESAILYSLNEDMNSDIEYFEKSASLLRWALKNSKKQYIKKYAENLGMNKKLAESLNEFYEEESEKSKIKSATRDKSIMFKWALKNALIDQIDIFRKAMNLENHHVIDYAIAMNYDLYGALIYSIEEDLYDSVERLVSKFGWGFERNLNKISEFLERAIRKEDISDFEVLIKVPEICHFISNNWDDIISFAKALKADEIISFMNDFDILNEKESKVKESKGNEVFCGEGIKPLTDTIEAGVGKIFINLKQVIYSPQKSPNDSGIDMDFSLSSSSLDDIIHVAEEAKHRLDVTFIVDPATKLCSLGEVGEAYC